jgi:hypothetical protein
LERLLFFCLPQLLMHKCAAEGLVDTVVALGAADFTPLAHLASTLQVHRDSTPQVPQDSGRLHPVFGLQALPDFNPGEFSPVVFDPRASDPLVLWALDRVRVASAPLDHAQPVSGHFHPPEERLLGRTMW